MANFWNEFELKKPPLLTLHVANTAFAKQVFVNINRYLQQLNEPDALEFQETAALIGRLMARRKNSFKTMIGFRSVCKLNSALCRLLRLDVPRDLKQFRSSLPDVCDSELAGEMPTRSSFEYILVRLIALYHIYKRIRECCLAAAKYFSQMLRNNFFLDVLTLLIAAIAKINKLSAVQANKCASLYNQLLLQRSHFPLVEKHRFLSDECVFPPNLLHIELPPAEKKPDVHTTSVSLKAPPLITRFDKAKLIAKSDVGQVIERKPTPNAQFTFNLETLATVADVKHFIARESLARHKTPQNCLTKSIQKHEWLAAQTLFERKMQSNEHAKALKIFRKFIGSKI